MTHNFKHIITLAFSIIINCFSMNEKQNILDQLIPKNSIPQIEFLTDDRVVVNINYFCRHKGCYLVDLKENKIIKTIEIDDIFKNPKTIGIDDILKNPHNGSYNMNLAVHPNKKLFSLSLCKGIALYDTETGIQKNKCTFSFKPLEARSKMNPTSDTVLFWNHSNSCIVEWNYIRNHIHTTHMQPASLVEWVACHPKKQEIFVTTWNYSNIYNHDFSEIIKEIKDITRPYFAYSPDGSLIAYSQSSTDFNFITIISSDSYNTLSNFVFDKNNIRAIAFHPNNKLLAVVTDNNATIKYIHVNEKKFVARQPTSHENKNNFSVQLSFSPNSKKIIVSFAGAYFISDIPFEAFYKPEAQERLPYILFLLKNYHFDQYNPPSLRPSFAEASEDTQGFLLCQNYGGQVGGQVLPQDIINLLMQTALETFKRT